MLFRAAQWSGLGQDSRGGRHGVHAHCMSFSVVGESGWAPMWPGGCAPGEGEWTRL